MSTIITKRQFPHYHKYTMDLAGRPLTLEVGKLAELANAAVMVGYGDTRVLCCVTAAPRPRDGIDFFPLSVDFEEKMYAVGRIPGSFNRREGRPGEKGILTSRVIDRPIRPLFPYDFRNDVSVMCTVMAVDHDCSPEIAALIGTSAALAISDIPWNGPVAALKVGLVDGKLVFNPDSEQRKVSDLDVTVVSTGKKVVMIEAGANEVPNDVMFEAIRSAHEENQKQIALINQMVAEIGKPKFEYPHADFNYELFNKITADFMDEAKAAMDTDDKNVREQRWNAMIEKWHEKYLEEYPNMDQYLEEITYKFQKMIVKKWLLEGHRVDGRQKNEIRPLDAEVGVLPRVHGSGLFTRGQTQVLSVCTLDTLSANQKLDTIWEETEKRYMHHYNFPSYSVGEARGARSVNRREKGHGALAERALDPVIPSVEEFPYAIRVVSEVVSSNGSTSQGSICPPAVCVFLAHRGPPLELDFRCVVEHFVLSILGTDRLSDDGGCFFPGNPLYKCVAVKIAVFHKCFSGGLFQPLNQFVFFHRSYPPLFQIMVRLGNHGHADLLRGAVEVYEAENIDQLAGVLYGVDAVDLEVNSLVPHLDVCLAEVVGVLSHPLQCGDGFNLEIFGPRDLLLSTLHDSFLLWVPLSLCF